MLMSRKREFHPALSTLDIAKFQLMEQGFVGIANGVTLVPAKDARVIEASYLKGEIDKYLERITTQEDAHTLILALKAFLDIYPEDPACAAIVVFKPSVREGFDNVQPVGRIIDPWEVVEPEFAHTDGAGNVREDDRTGNNPSKLNGSSGDETDNK